MMVVWQRPCLRQRFLARGAWSFPLGGLYALMAVAVARRTREYWHPHYARRQLPAGVLGSVFRPCGSSSSAAASRRGSDDSCCFRGVLDSLGGGSLVSFGRSRPYHHGRGGRACVALHRRAGGR